MARMKEAGAIADFKRPGDFARRVTLRQLEIFSAVARTGGVTRASEALHLTQPTVSMQIRKLSRTIGVDLFETVGRRLVLTPEGERLLQAAGDVFDRLDAFEEVCRALSGEVKGRLRIAGVMSAKYFLPRLLGEFLREHPAIEPHFSVTNRARLIDRLRMGEDDLVIMGRVPTGLEVEAHPFLDNELVVVAPADHPLAGRPGVPLAEIARTRLLVREPGSGTRVVVDSLFAEAGLTFRPTMELGSAEAIKQAVLAGLGVSVLPRLNVAREVAGGDLAILDVEGFPLHREWFAVHLKGRRLSPATRGFLEFLRTHAEPLLEERRPAASFPDDNAAREISSRGGG